MANLITAMKNEQNFTYTENGAGTYSSTMSGILDLFGLGAAYRTRSEQDCLSLFAKAWAEDQTLALKCLFYLRDIRGGQGERRFFRVVLNDLAKTNPNAVRRNLENIVEYGRWDDLYCLMGTSLEKDVFALFQKQLKLDMTCKTPSLLAKWLKSENASSAETKRLGTKTRLALGISAREYRKMLSKLRQKINIVERLMSSNRWDEIEFDKIPSRAGFIYKNAFARRDIIKAKYERFMKNEKTKVNAAALYPYEVVHQLMQTTHSWSWPTANQISDLDRAVLNKYWANLKDYINGANLNALAIVDTSGSMNGTPIEVAVSLGMICAERCSGPYHNHFLTFSIKPRLQELVGDDFVAKACNLVSADWDGNTNLEAAFDLVLNTAIKNKLSQKDLPETLIVISDMEFDSCVCDNSYRSDSYCYWRRASTNPKTLMETMEQRWRNAGYKMPKLVFWNVNARNDRIPMKIQDGVSFVSGFSPVLFEQVIKGKTAWDLVLDKLLSERYEAITV